jgi:FkbM family methyltransferase
MKNIEYTFWNFRETELFKQLEEQLRPPTNVSTWGKTDHISNLLKGGMFYETHTLLQFYKDIPKEGMILDIGANIGNHQIMFNQLYPNREIFGFEASPLNYTHLHRNTMNYPNTTNLCVGLGAEQGLNSLTHFTENMGGSGIRKVSNLRYQEKDIMPIITEPLDLFQLDSNISLMKIDVENYESYVIKGAHKTIEEHKPMIWIEDFKHDDDYNNSTVKYLVDNFEYKTINKSEGNFLLKTQI